MKWEEQPRIHSCSLFINKLIKEHNLVVTIALAEASTLNKVAEMVCFGQLVQKLVVLFGIFVQSEALEVK